jgi:hypothetical protein
MSVREVEIVIVTGIHYRQGRPSIEQLTPPPEFEHETFRLAAR